MSDQPLRVGLAGAGPWATMVHAPMLAAGPETVLAGVWARRADAAAELAAKHGAPSFTSFDDLLEACDAVAFAVPPAVQAGLATRAASAGKALLLEKPVAADLPGAVALADAVRRAGVVSMVLFAWRYAEPVRAFLDAQRAGDALGGRGIFVSSGSIEGPFRTPWRLERGPLLDLGPHVLDLLDAAFGPIVSVRAAGDVERFVSLLLEHESGVATTATVSANVAGPAVAGVEAYHESGTVAVDCAGAVGGRVFKTVRHDFAVAVAGGGHPLDVHRGVHVQRLLAEAERQLGRGT